jgi:hypothetical protein
MSDATTPDNLRAAGQDALRTRSDLKGVLLLALMIGACIVLIDVHVLLHTGEHLPVAMRRSTSLASTTSAAARTRTASASR